MGNYRNLANGAGGSHRVCVCAGCGETGRRRSGRCRCYRKRTSRFINPSATAGLPTENGEVELDAAYMDGDTLAFGAVGNLVDIANPVRVARAEPPAL